MWPAGGATAHEASPSPLAVGGRPNHHRSDIRGRWGPVTCRLCDRPVRARGLCVAHYQTEWRGRKPDGPPPPPTFPGRGVLVCLVCGEPYVEHAIGPCPKLEEPVLR
jgi:hypothetical protein